MLSSCPNKRCRFTPNARSSQAEFPLLPFPIDQALVPSESKTLHLYEARYLALLEEVLDFILHSLCFLEESCIYIRMMLSTSGLWC
ncbi:hypothetical protein F0562_028323 [Nyssa sinensis]|uniref:Lon N-terminal domain-containing protein n=1 Tax=Nyssa sinensis TaxID=561372 RepID=A0A5J5B8M5_9ASTE|nr:hypothetical protein F0562_028323 [Nyssa sinensis]